MKYGSNCVLYILLDPFTTNLSEIGCHCYLLVGGKDSGHTWSHKTYLSLGWLQLMTVGDSISILPCTSYLYIISSLPGGVSLIVKTVTTIRLPVIKLYQDAPELF